MKLEVKGKRTLPEILSVFEDGKRYYGPDYANAMNHAKNVLSKEEFSELVKHFQPLPRFGSVLVFHKDI